MHRGDRSSSQKQQLRTAKNVPLNGGYEHEISFSLRNGQRQRMLCSLMDTAVCLSDAISDKIGSREFPDGRSFPCVWTLFAHWNIHALSPGLFEERRALLKHPQVHSFTADEQTIS
ncbi:hypothetical protein CEXT_348701 [Caerostris extrusa]|uniref:Uncharacterized protein n=1 Tax=Caerostris extrusa TaxID=172846 RepID=A0AAV4XS10_CAEEX|nr:hypothetical protein CEXT_348701 [Caerostris extrusa]